MAQPRTLSVPRSTPRRRGRPQACYRRPDGTQVIGLSRQADGRWRISGTGEVFFEPDENLALARFEQVMATLRGQNTVELPIRVRSIEGAVAAAARAGGTRLRMKIKPNEPTTFAIAVNSDSFWAAVRRLLLEDPKRVALRTGIEWVARGAELPQPKPSPTLQHIGNLYCAKSGLSTNEAGRSRLFWKEFTTAVGISTVRELTHEHLAQYEAMTQERKLSAKSRLHRFRKIRTVFAYAIKRGIGIDDCRRALDITAMLEVKDHAPLDPQPVSAPQFRALLRAAVRAKDNVFAAMLLLSLNAALYPGEAASIRWDEIDLQKTQLVTRRPKTGVSRIAVLWPETCRALKLIPRIGEYVFNTKVRSYTVFSALASWRKYRTAAKLGSEVVFSRIRDAAYSIALTVSLEQAKLLAGHRLAGAADHYVRRNPQMVGEACKEIYRAFTPFL